MNTMDYSDFCHRFIGAYIGVRPSKEDNVVVPALIREVLYRGPRSAGFNKDTAVKNWQVVASLVNEDGPFGHQEIDFGKVLSAGGEVMFNCPPMGYVNDKTTCVFISRLPERQFKMGLVPRQLRVFCPNSYEVSKVYNKSGHTEVGIGAKMIYKLYNNTFYSIEDAIELLYSGKRLGCAITPDFALVARSKIKCPVLCYKKKQVGHIDMGRSVLYKAYEDLFESVGAAVGMPIEVQE